MENQKPVDGQISEAQVMSSAAGYYIGQRQYDESCKCWFPYDRLSGYYRTHEDAEKVLPAYREI